MDEDRPLDETFRLMFAPDDWGALGRFSAFLGPPFQNTKKLKASLQSCSDRRLRIETLVSLANRLESGLWEDRQELQSKGFTPANGSREYVAIIEAIICELYSILDGLRYIVYFGYGGLRGVQKKSTSKLFSRASEDEYDKSFPDALRNLLKEAYEDWFKELRAFRTELTHGRLGSCHLDAEARSIQYFHSGLGERGDTLVIDNLPNKVEELGNKVFELLESVGEHFYGKLEYHEVSLPCGFYKGRVYTRRVGPEENLSRQSGCCESLTWFEDKPGYMCPLASDCQAYTRAKLFKE